MATRKYLLSCLNDNIFRNLDINLDSVKKYQFSDVKKSGFRKDAYGQEKLFKVIDEFVLKKQGFEEQGKSLKGSLDKILLTHRNTRIFLFMLSGPFLIGFTILKYGIKFSIFMLIWNHK